MDETKIEKILKAVASKRRLSILKQLRSRKETPVNTIARQIKLSFRSTSKHLAILYASDLVEREQKSTLVYYRLSPKGIKVISAINSVG